MRSKGTKSFECCKENFSEKAKKGASDADFLIQDKNKVIPIEVNAEENLKAKSLKQFVTDNASETAYRISMFQLREESWMTNIHLYAVETL